MGASRRACARAPEGGAKGKTLVQMRQGKAGASGPGVSRAPTPRKRATGILSNDRLQKTFEISEIRIERNGLIVIGGGTRQIASLAPDKGAIVVIDRRHGIQFDGAIVIGQRAIEVAPGKPRRATVSPCGREVGLELDRLCTIGDGAVEISHAVTGGAPAIVGFGAFG